MIKSYHERELALLSKAAYKITLSIVVVLAVVLCSVVFYFMPIGGATERVIYRLSAPLLMKAMYDENSTFYPVAKNLFFRDIESLGREAYLPSNKLVGVVIDDQELQQAELSFPLRYDQYAAHLQAIANYQPKAIFVDILFTQNRASDDSMKVLVDKICELANPTLKSSQPIKIYLSSVSYKGTALHSELQKFSDRNTQDNTPCFIEVSVKVSNSGEDTLGWYYPVSQCDAEGECSNPMTSAAVRIYNDMYAACSADQITNHNQDSFLVLWGHGTHSRLEFEKFYAALSNTELPKQFEPECKESIDGFAGLKAFFIPVRHEQCPPFNMYRPSDLLTAELGSHSAYTHLSAQIQDGVVFYGVKLSGIRDYVNSPVHGRTVGALYHAAALHNLDRLGTRPFYASTMQGPSDVKWPEWYLMVLLAMLAGTRIVYNGLFAKNDGDTSTEKPNSALGALLNRTGRFLMPSVESLTFLLAILIITVASVVHLQIDPVFGIAMLGLSIAASKFSILFEIINAVLLSLIMRLTDK